MNYHEDIKLAVETLRNGGLILYPTDTIWGIGCDATNPEAVQKVYALKNRTDKKSMLVLLESSARLNAYIREVPPVAYDLVELSDKPLTIIYPEAKNLAPNLLATDGSIGIRITSESFSRTLCQRFKKPIVSTSANISGTSAPGCFSEISETILRGVDYVVKFKQNEQFNSAPSSIIKLGVTGEIKIIRD